MKTIELTQAEFDAMPDYSKSVSNDLYAGRTWKRKTLPYGGVMSKVVLQGNKGNEWYEIVIKD